MTIVIAIAIAGIFLGMLGAVEFVIALVVAIPLSILMSRCLRTVVERRNRTASPAGAATVNTQDEAERFAASVSEPAVERRRTSRRYACRTSERRRGPDFSYRRIQSRTLLQGPLVGSRPVTSRMRRCKS